MSNYTSRNVYLAIPLLLCIDLACIVSKFKVKPPLLSESISFLNRCNISFRGFMQKTPLSIGRSEGLRFLAGRSGSQQPFAEERCDGYAALLLSPSCGLVSRRRVCGHPLRRCLTSRGFFMTCRRLSLDRPYRFCYNMCCVFQSPAGQHLREHHGTASAILRPVAVFL